MNERYEIILGWSSENEAFVAEVPELPGCAAHGQTLEEALKHGLEAMSLWFDVAREAGVPTP